MEYESPNILQLIMSIIQVDIVLGFGAYSLLYYIVRRFTSKQYDLIQFDKSACQLLIFAGILFGVLWLTNLALEYWQASELEQGSIRHRITGPYWFGYWLQPLFWIGLILLLLFRRLRNSILFRLILSFFFLFTFERIVIIITSLHRDYLPTNWSLGISYWELAVGLILKMSVFIILVSLYHFGIKALYLRFRSKP